MTLKQHVAGTVVFLLVAVPLFAQNAYHRTTIRLGAGTTAPYCTPWVDSGAKAGTAWANTTNYIEIFPETQYQTVTAWGGTIQERQWVTMQPLSAAGKDSVMRALFDTSGCNIGYLRVSIGCSDFDINEAPISLNETAGDYAMNNFSLKRDSTRKIPLIKMAQAINPNLRFWGCPWSPPRWMHDNNDYQSGMMKSDANTLTAYALYLEKFVQGYQAAGINIEMVCCQNEPTIYDGGYPKCGWTNALEKDFYKNYLIPLFKKDNISARIFLGVFCCGNYEDWITYLMSDATIAGFVGATSHSYQSPDWGQKAVTDYPTIPFFQTEAPFGPWPDVGPQNWDRGRDLFNNVSDFMNYRTSVYTLWNMVNDETAKSGWNWAQTVAIQVNSSTKQVTYNPWFYAYKHFGNYVKPGAKAVRYSPIGTIPGKITAFRNPNGDVILVTSNQNASAYSLTVKVGTKMWKATLPPNSFNTLKMATGTTVLAEQRKVAKAAMPMLSNARISNSTLNFTLQEAAGAREMNITLRDLQGRTVWTGHSKSGTILGGQQTFTVKRPQGGLLPGSYLLTVRIKNNAGSITTVENKVTAVN
jgi:glucosylceramidase